MIDKNAVLDRINISSEIIKLLPEGKGSTRRCFNKIAHAKGDKVPSLSVDMNTSAWRCHACNEAGDLFGLWAKLNNTTYSEALLHYGRETGVVRAIAPARRVETELLQNDNKDMQSYLNANLPDEICNFIKVRYCISASILKQHGIRWDERTKRLLIPVYDVQRRILNIRKHDILRHYADWETADGHAAAKPFIEDIMNQSTDLIPVWRKAGKTLSVKGHGSNRLYGMELAPNMPHGALLIVGGELKALAMRELGIPAISFTTGEGSINEEDIKLFSNNTFIVLLDPDAAGVKAAIGISALLKCGRYTWPQAAIDELPYKGDITDLIRLHSNEWEQHLSYVGYKEAPPEDDEKCLDIQFRDLVDPTILGKRVTVEALIAGKSEVPFVVPYIVDAECPLGRAHPTKLCENCSLPGSKFKKQHIFTLPKVVEFAGKKPDHVLREAIDTVGIPKSCTKPVINITKAAVDPIVVAPTIKYEDEDPQIRQHPIYVISDQVLNLIEGNSYRFGGQIIPDPQHGRFMLAANEYHRTSDDALTFCLDEEKHEVLTNMFGGERPGEALHRLVTQLKEYVCHIYSQDDMLKSILLCMFMPFSFSLAGQNCERVCPQVCILGDSNVGKSTACRNLIRYYGSGRFYDAGSNPTFAGLIGGNVTMPNKSQMFTWGVLPQAHRAFVAMDEFNKLPVTDIARLTNVLSSGRAERVTVGSGGRSTPCHVRLLTLANARDNHNMKGLRALNITKAVNNLYGSPQDLGRVEFIHVQLQVQEDVYNQKHHATSDLLYTQKLARYHMSWVWSLKKDDIIFSDDEYVLTKSRELGGEYNSHPLLYPQQVRWKVARVAAGIASLLYSNEGGRLLVTNKHVDMAYQWLIRKANEIYGV
jgi:hypothetical protein